MVFYAAFNSISVISRQQLTLFMLSCVSPVLGKALKCLAQRHSHEKNPEDLVRLEPRTPGLRIKHLTTEPPFPHKPWFSRVCSTSLLKTLWEKEKLFVKSNFSFSLSVFYSFGELSSIFIKFKIVVCKLFQFGKV